MSYDPPSRTWSVVASRVSASGVGTEGDGFMRYLTGDEKAYGWTARGADGEQLYTVRGTSLRIAAP